MKCYWEAKEYIKQYKIYDKANYKEIKRELSEYNWKEKFENIDVVEKWEIFIDTMNSIIERHVPTVNHRFKKFSFPLDKNMRELLKKKDKLSRLYFSQKKQGKDNMAVCTWKEYTKLRNKVRKLTRQSRKEMEEAIAKQVKNNPKKAYAYMNSKTKVRAGVGKICINPNDPKSDTTDDDKEKAKIFSDFFKDVQTREPKGEIPYLKNKNIETIMEDINITKEGVHRI